MKTFKNRFYSILSMAEITQEHYDNEKNCKELVGSQGLEGYYFAKESDFSKSDVSKFLGVYAAAASLCDLNGNFDIYEIDQSGKPTGKLDYGKIKQCNPKLNSKEEADKFIGGLESALTALTVITLSKYDSRNPAAGNSKLLYDLPTEKISLSDYSNIAELISRYADSSHFETALNIIKEKDLKKYQEIENGLKSKKNNEAFLSFADSCRIIIDKKGDKGFKLDKYFGKKLESAFLFLSDCYKSEERQGYAKTDLSDLAKLAENIGIKPEILKKAGLSKYIFDKYMGRVPLEAFKQDHDYKKLLTPEIEKEITDAYNKNNKKEGKKDSCAGFPPASLMNEPGKKF